jgi:hypothetical protein
MKNLHKDSYEYQAVLKRKWGINNDNTMIRHFPAWNYVGGYEPINKIYFAYLFDEFFGRPRASFLGFCDRFGRPLQ